VLILLPVLLTVVTNLPPESTTPAVTLGKFTTISLILLVHLDLQISSGISKKSKMILTIFSGVWGKMIHEKNLKQKISIFLILIPRLKDALCAGAPTPPGPPTCPVSCMA
jgi:hypothetical protein